MTERPDHATIAAVDVGTNSVHMVVARVDPKGFHILTTEKEVVRLGEGSGGLDHLTPEAIDRGVDALRRMRQIADSQGAVIRAVATSAVREADNQQEFIDAVKTATGIGVQVITGPEEARLIHLGVGRSMNLGDDQVLTIDIGGGSTEFCVSSKGSIRITQSLKLGAVRMTDAFVPSGTLTDGGLRKMREKIRESFAPLAHDISRAGFSRVVLSSGTNETIARMASATRGGDEPVSFNGFRFSRQELNAVVRSILEKETARDRLGLPGLDPKRSDIIAAGSVILHEIARELGIDSFEFSEFALREGVLVDTAQRLGVLGAERVDAAHGSVLRLAQRCSVDMEHASHVAQLAGRILAAVSRHFEVDQSLRRLLNASALLADTGKAISYSRHHLHSYYIIRNADLLGFSDLEIQVIALVARYGRKSQPKMSHAEFAVLPEERRHDVELLAGVLRIATGLDRAHDQSIAEVSSSNKDGELVLTFRHGAGSSDHVELNLRSAQSQTQLLADYLGEQVVIRDGGPARA